LRGPIAGCITRALKHNPAAIIFLRHRVPDDSVVTSPGLPAQPEPSWPTLKSNSDNTLRVALVGAGYISDFHAEAVSRSGRATVVAVCDLSRSRAEQLASRLGATAYTSVAEMLTGAKPDVAHILTPPSAHLAVTETLLAAGVHCLVEKPLVLRAAECAPLAALANKNGVSLGVSHNFLFAEPYERFARDVKGGRIGRIDHFDIVWNKPLGQVRGGPFGGWLFADPRNVLFEVGPHSFAHVIDLLGVPDSVRARASDPVLVPGGRVFYRKWEVDLHKGRTTAQLRFGFGDGYTEHRVHARGGAGSATVDYELNTYVCQEPVQDQLDIDHFATALRAGRDLMVQAGATFVETIRAKAKLGGGGAPYAAGIARATASFYATLGGRADSRLSPELAAQSLALAEQVAHVVTFEGEPVAATTSENPAAHKRTRSAAAPTVLVLGGTGFIGKALVARLCAKGYAVRLIARDPASQDDLKERLGVEVVRGDLSDTASIAAAMDGITDVYHLARGYGRTWDDYQRMDIEPTRRLGALCAERRARLLYASSIVIYDGGRADEVITEDTPAGAETTRVNLYARAKVECERLLMDLRNTSDLNLVIFRPGIVLGRGGNPFHWGISMWPQPSFCRLWGDGTNKLPIVLVEDCADAMVLALAASGTKGQSFNLVGDASVSAIEYIDEVQARAGMRIRRSPTPAWRFFAEDMAKYAVKTVGRVPDRRHPSYRDYVGRAARATISGERAKTVLGWKPNADREALIRDGIYAAVDDYLR